MARMHEDDIYSEENRCYLNICYLIPSVVTRGRVCLSDIYRRALNVSNWPDGLVV